MSSSAEPDAEARAQRGLLRALIGAIFMVFLDTRVVAALLPSMAGSYGVSIPRAGLLISAYMVPYGLCQLMYGPIADRIGKVRVIRATMIVFSIGTIACGFTSSFALMVALRAITGCAAAAVFPMTLAYVGDTVPYATRQATIAQLLAGAGAASTTSAAFGAAIAEVFSWQWVFPVFGSLGALVTVWIAAVAHRERRVAPNKVGALAAYRTALANRVLRLLVVLSFVEGALYFGCFSYLGAAFQARFAVSTFGIGVFLSFAGIAQLASAWLLPKVLRRWQEARLLLGGGLCMGGGLIVAAVAPHPYVYPLAMLCAGAGFTFCHSTLQARATEALPAHRGTAIALFAFALFVGSGLGTVAIGELLPALGYEHTLLAAGLGLWLFTFVASRVSKPPART